MRVEGRPRKPSVDGETAGAGGLSETRAVVQIACPRCRVIGPTSRLAEHLREDHGVSDAAMAQQMVAEAKHAALTRSDVERVRPPSIPTPATSPPAAAPSTLPVITSPSPDAAPDDDAQDNDWIGRRVKKCSKCGKAGHRADGCGRAVAKAPKRGPGTAEHLIGQKPRSITVAIRAYSPGERNHYFTIYSDFDKVRDVVEAALRGAFE